MKIVSFFGHKYFYYFPEYKFRQKLAKILEKIAEKDSVNFLLNDYSPVDNVFTKEARIIKERYPDTLLTLVTTTQPPCDEENIYTKIDVCKATGFAPLFDARTRVRYVVEKSDIIIAYCETKYCGTQTIIDYAKQLKKEVILIKK